MCLAGAFGAYQPWTGATIWHQRRRRRHRRQRWRVLTALLPGPGRGRAPQDDVGVSDPSAEPVAPYVSICLAASSSRCRPSSDAVSLTRFAMARRFDAFSGRTCLRTCWCSFRAGGLAGERPAGSPGPASAMTSCCARARSSARLLRVFSETRGDSRLASIYPTPIRLDTSAMSSRTNG